VDRKGIKGEDKVNRKAEKKERKRSKKKLGINPQKKQKQKSPNFGLCACVKAKYCTIYNNLVQNLA